MNKVREGYKITEIGDIPIEWEVRYLEDVCEILDSYRKPIKASDREEMKGDIPYYGASGVIDWINDFIFDEELILLGEDGENLNSRNTDLAFKISGKSWVNNHAHVFRIANKNRDNIDFMVYYLESKDYSRYIAGSAQPKITQAQCRKFLLPSPDLKEQEKIASILSTVDEQIDNVDALIEKNKELKKGLMQTLLTKGIGHTKFKKTEIGEIPEEWEVVTLGNISRNKGEYGIGASASEFIEGKARYLRITDIGDECNLLFNDIKGLNDNEYEKYLLSIGDVVFARTGNTTGKSYVYEENHGELVYAGFLIKFSINLDICKSNFIKYVIQTKRYWDWVAVMSTRSGQPGINSNEYSGFLVQLPPIEEQEKIASILSKVDKKIEEYKNKKQKLENLKKGLMQQLLTGKIRAI